MAQLTVRATLAGGLQSGGTWTQATNGTYNVSAYPTDGHTTLWCGCDYWQGSYPNNPNHHQTFMGWDTSSISADSTVTAVQLSMTPSGHGVWEQVQTWEVFAYNWYPNAGEGDGRVDLACWQDSSELTSLYNGGAGLVASVNSNQFSSWEGVGGAGPISEDETFDLTMGAGANAAIVKAGTTRMMMTVDSNRTFTQPTIHCREEFYLNAATTESYRPTLTITYSGPSVWTGITVTHRLQG